MPITLNLQHNVQTRAQPTPRAMEVAVMFGLSMDGTHEHVILPPIELTLKPGEVVFVTGVSGGGKSTLLRLIQSSLQQNQYDALPSHDAPALILNEQLPTLIDSALVDALAKPEGKHTTESTHEQATLDQVCRWLSQAGLNDAAVMLRTPSELSEGQRHRLRLAQAMAAAERRPEAWSVLLADEFGSSLDRTTAFALARSVRRWVSRSRVCLVAATAHDDLLEPLRPDVLIEVAPGGQCDVHRH